MKCVAHSCGHPISRRSCRTQHDSPTTFTTTRYSASLLLERDRSLDTWRAMRSNCRQGIYRTQIQTRLCQSIQPNLHRTPLESKTLPSVKLFAVCISSGTGQTNLCQVTRRKHQTKGQHSINRIYTEFLQHGTQQTLLFLLSSFVSFFGTLFVFFLHLLNQ